MFLDEWQMICQVLCKISLHEKSINKFGTHKSHFHNRSSAIRPSNAQIKRAIANTY